MGKLFGYVLVAAVLLIEVPRFMAAFAGLDGTPLTAFGTAVALSGGSMYVFHTWWTSARKLRNWLLLPFGLNLVLAGAILVPWGVARLWDVPLAEVVTGGWAWAWVSVAVLSPFVLVGGITTALAFQKEQHRKPLTRPEREPEKAVPEPVLSEQERAVVGAYRDGAASYQQVADAVGIGKTTVGERVNGLIGKGVLERTPSGVAVRSGNGRG